MSKELGVALASIYSEYLFQAEREAPQLPYGSAKQTYKPHELKKIHKGRKKNKLASIARKKTKKV